MWSFTAYYASKYDDSIVTTVEYHLVSTIDEFKTARNSLYMNVFRKSAMLFQSLDSSVKQGTCYLWVPFCYHDTEAHVAGIWNLGKVVFRQIMKCCCHNVLI